MADWSASQYLKFKKERTQAAIDLAGRIDIADPSDILDVGCGPGNSTAVLQEAYPKARILGIDNSDDMICAAKAAHPSLEFQKCDASTELAALGKSFDIVFSNACLQWIPNHRQLISNLMKLLTPGGELAVQIPMNYDEPVHQIIGRIAKSEPWCKKFSNPRTYYNLAPEEYYDLLANEASDFSMWQTTYFHRMQSHEAIMEWYRATGLRPYLDALCDEDAAVFYQMVLTEIEKAYPKQENGEVIFRFPRFFFVAKK